jgi:hypothetical protein
MIGARTILAGLILGGTLMSCMDDRHAGSTTQTENTAAARTFRVDSILPCWNRPFFQPTVATLKLDSANFDFQETDSAGRDLAVQNVAGESVPFEVDGWDKTARMGRLYVRIDTGILRHGSNFVLRWKQPLESRSNADSVWKSISDSQKLNLRSVLVDDFENGNDTAALPTHPVWETYISDTARPSSIKYVAAGGNRFGKALMMDSATMTRGKLVFKVPLIKGRQPRSIRSMDSLVFWIRGTKGASTFVAFDHYSLFKAWKLDTLDSVWTRVRYRPSDLVPASDSNGGNRGWIAVRDSVTDLTFIVNGGNKLYLDDIRIYGLDRDDLK